MWHNAGYDCKTWIVEKVFNMPRLQYDEFIKINVPAMNIQVVTTPYASDVMQTAWKPGYTNPYIYEPEEGEPDPRLDKDQVEDQK